MGVLCIVIAAALYCEPRLLKAWADQDKPHDQGDIMAWVCESTAVLLHDVSTVRACFLHSLQKYIIDS